MEYLEISANNLLQAKFDMKRIRSVDLLKR